MQFLSIKIFIQDIIFLSIFSFFHFFIEKNKKRDVRNWFNHEPGTSAEQYQQQIPLDIDRRGDIPIMSGDCEGKIMQNKKKNINTIILIMVT